MSGSGPVDDLVAQMQSRLNALPADSPRRPFLSTYLRTTQAVSDAVKGGRFLDPAWVERWDVAFANLYLQAHDALLSGQLSAVPRPWRLAFTAPDGLPTLRHVLLGINAHVNYDLPQAMLSVISPRDFHDERLVHSRRRDHERIDDVLASRVKDEDDRLGDTKALLDRVLAPLNRLASKRFLREARQKVWRNVEALHAARLDSDTLYATRLGELEVLSAARIADLLAPGQVLLRLAVAGFGVTLPPAA
ncbi:MAG: DUF5995 family protein [Actinomycetota bacterium]|nr:DUF5995 family protein [Actinomycetota bacterium]